MGTTRGDCDYCGELGCRHCIPDEVEQLRTALSLAEQRNVELDLAMREQSRLLPAAQDAHKAANRRIAELEASCDGWHRRACSHADAADEARERLATAEQERDEARKDSRRIDFLEQFFRVVMPSGRHWIDYDYSGDLRSALDTSMEKLP